MLHIHPLKSIFTMDWCAHGIKKPDSDKTRLMVSYRHWTPLGHLYNTPKACRWQRTQKHWKNQSQELGFMNCPHQRPMSPVHRLGHRFQQEFCKTLATKHPNQSGDTFQSKRGGMVTQHGTRVWHGKLGNAPAWFTPNRKNDAAAETPNWSLEHHTSPNENWFLQVLVHLSRPWAEPAKRVEQNATKSHVCLHWHQVNNGWSGWFQFAKYRICAPIKVVEILYWG